MIYHREPGSGGGGMMSYQTNRRAGVASSTVQSEGGRTVLAGLHHLSGARLRRRLTTDDRAATWAKVRAALADPAWDYRTVNSIAEERGLPPAVVKQLLFRHRTEVRPVLTRDRGVIYRLRSRRGSGGFREFLLEAQAFASL